MKGRFAPSPTGAMHLGNARTALLAWLQARSSGGRMVMRVEDLDSQRTIEGAEARLLAELAWLGLDWDEGPFRQSDRATEYAAAIARLLEDGRAFECACSRAEIARAASAPHAGEDAARYPGTCRDLPPGEAASKAKAQGRTPAVRFRGSGERVGFADLVRGEVDPLGSAGLDDFVIQRADGIAAYQLAVVVDDAAMGISHVLRADDLLESTPRQIALYRALGLEVPVFAHVPLVLAPGGDRLAKRNRPATVGDLRAAGVSAETIAGVLAASAGLVPAGTRATPRELIAAWDPAKLSREPVELDAASFASTGNASPPSAATLRAARGGDAIPLAEVYVASWRAAYRGMVPDEILEALSVATQTARWQKMLMGLSRGENRAWVVEEDGAMRGFIVTGPVRGGVEAGCAEVWAMYLDPAAWRRGLGRRLMAHAEADLVSRGFTRLTLWVLARNAQARAFYEALGFRTTGETRREPMGSAFVEDVRYRAGIG